MNRKNTILIAVMINAGLLAVLLVAALTTQDEIPASQTFASDSSHTLPKFDDVSLFSEINPAVQSTELPIVIREPEPVLHQLPALIAETPPVAQISPPAPIATVPSVSGSTSSAMPMNQIVVKKGDSLEKIARANHTTVDQIVKLNQLSNTSLKIGQVLKIPTEKTIAKSAEKKLPELASPEYYTMKVGDNPWAIAMKHHMKVEELLRLNGLNEERARKLKPGDRLRIR